MEAQYYMKLEMQLANSCLVTYISSQNRLAKLDVAVPDEVVLYDVA